jgi:hypothetical protein
LAQAVANLARTEAVRADRRLRTDEKAIRAQSTISDKSNPKSDFVLTITGSMYGWIFIRTSSRLARAARNFVRSRATSFASVQLSPQSRDNI